MKGMRIEDIMKNLTSESEKVWFAWAIAKVVIADQKMTKDEAVQMKELFLKNCSPQVSAEIANSLKLNKPIHLDALKLADRGAAAKIIKYLVVIAAIDEDISDVEVQCLHEIGGKLGFTASTINQTIAWRKRTISKQKELIRGEHDITLHLRTEPPNYF